MALALSLGRRGQGRVWPNPSVGCVIVKDGRIVGRGRTADGGRPHAETEALSQAGQNAAGATVYVTLEPCAHHGQTPPCVEALLEAGVGRVVIATTDPDPRVNGKGVARLQKAGVDVEVGVMQPQAATDLAGFLKRNHLGRPWLTLKLATTIDGRIATCTGDSQWITGPQARARVHRMRATHDAVMVGAGTARVDDPTLNVRGFGAVPQPVRVVISSNLDLPMDGKLIETAASQPLWLCHGSDAVQGPWQKSGARLFKCKTQDSQVDLKDALAQLGQAGLTRVLCEGGGGIAAALLRAGLVDELVVFGGGRLIGADGLACVANMGVAALSDGPAFDLLDVEQIGPDVMHRWRPV